MGWEDHHGAQMMATDWDRAYSEIATMCSRCFQFVAIRRAKWEWAGSTAVLPFCEECWRLIRPRQQQEGDGKS